MANDIVNFAMAAHAGAASDRPLFDRAASRTRERLEGVLGLHVEAIDVIQVTVPGLGPL